MFSVATLVPLDAFQEPSGTRVLIFNLSNWLVAEAHLQVQASLQMEEFWIALVTPLKRLRSVSRC